MACHYLYFDFGGCLDSPGIHTRTLFLREFLAHGLITLDERAKFQEAYSSADKKFMADGSVKTLGLTEFNRANAQFIADFLSKSGDVTLAADAVTEFQAVNLKHSHQVLMDLSEKVPLGVISNFTGNLEMILKEFDLHGFFHSITESFYVGASKPSEKIFLEALRKQQSAPGDCLFVGDNPVNDITPAKKLGMKTALIHLPGEKPACEADFYLTDLAQLKNILV
jgi:HAD superfamily hydrolase (TIGR01549 family)